MMMMNPEIDADQFAGYLLLRELADSTVRNYRCLFVRWTDYSRSRGRDPFAPDPVTVRAWAASMEGSRSLIAQARAVIGHLCQMLGVEDVSPAVPLPRRARALRTRALHPVQARRLAIAADRAGIAGLAVLVGLYTGARRSEIASLAWSNVDFTADAITLVRSKVRDRLTLPMAPALRDRLEQRHVPGDLWVFAGRHGGHVTANRIWEWVIEVAASAGVGHITPHQLRHTMITDVHDLSGNLRVAQDAGGHSNPQQTARYTRVTETQLRAAIAALPYLDVHDQDAGADEAA